MYHVNLAELHEAIAAAVPDEECLVWRDRRLTWSQVTERTRRLANALRDRGLGTVVPRSELAGHQSGQDHLACYLTNGNEYLEAMLGAYKARLAPFNVNYRYVAEELHHLLADAAARAVVVHSRFAPTLAAVLPDLPGVEVVLQVPDDSGHPLLPGAEWYEDALAAAAPERPDVAWSPDDLYILYTGGTTGLPKGVLWRQADIAVAAFGIRDTGGREFGSLRAAVDRAVEADRTRFCPAPPFMHGAGHWNAFSAWGRGDAVVVQSVTDRLDPVDLFRTIERERVGFLLIVGDAFAQPMLDELETGGHAYDLSSLRTIMSGGAALSAPRKARLLELLPHVTIIDGVGSSEAGGQLRQTTTSRGAAAATGTFVPDPDSMVLSDDRRSLLEPGHDGTGWLAKRGRIPLGYLGDEEKSATTFPVVGGVRYSVPGDRARLRSDGVVELLGRDSVTINSGGEKIFAEEVEAAISQHPGVYDVVVAGRPSDRWGAEVVAIVRLRPGASATADDLLAEAGRHVARYKLPKTIVFRDEIVRSPAGKADYRWAAAVASEG
jgi:3-oxocholest-4-en-26-oate---CoA ligase